MTFNFDSLSAAIVIGAVILSAETAHAVELNPAAVIYKLPNQIEWKGTGGNRSAVLVGDPEKPGLYIVINRENVDCVLRAGELTDQSLIARRIALLQMVTCAAPSYLARYGEPRHPTDLERDHRVVKYFRASDGRPLSLCVVATVAGLGILQGPKLR